jgi:hypothetical protein
MADKAELQHAHARGALLDPGAVERTGRAAAERSNCSVSRLAGKEYFWGRSVQAGVACAQGRLAWTSSSAARMSSIIAFFLSV